MLLHVRPLRQKSNRLPPAFSFRTAAHHAPYLKVILNAHQRLEFIC